MAIDKPHAVYGIWHAKVAAKRRKAPFKGVDMSAKQAMAGKISMDFGMTSMPRWFSSKFRLQRKPLL